MARDGDENVTVQEGLDGVNCYAALKRPRSERLRLAFTAKGKRQIPVYVSSKQIINIQE